MKWKPILFRILLVLSTLGIIVLLYVGYVEIQVKRIVSTSASLQYGYEIFKGKNTLLLDKNAISEYLLKRNPWVKSLDLRIDFPDTVFITVHERVPKATIRKGEFMALIDGEGIIVKRIHTADVSFPAIDIVDTPIHLTPPADWRIRKAAQYISELKNQFLPVTMILFDNRHAVYTMQTDNGLVIQIPYNLDTAATAASLQGIIARFRIEGKHVTKIDLRFGRPVAEFDTHSL